MKMKYKHSDSKNFFEINKFTESVWPLSLLAMNWVFHKQFYDFEKTMNHLSYVSNKYVQRKKKNQLCVLYKGLSHNIFELLKTS